MSEDNSQTYPDITDYGYVLNGKVYVKGNKYFEDREIGEVRETPEKSLNYYIDKYEIIKQKVERIKEKVETESNIGSYLVGLDVLTKRLKTYKGIGDYEYLFIIIEKLQSDINDYIQRNRIRNSELKEELLDELQELSESTEEWKDINEKVTRLKERWLIIGKAPSEEDKKFQRKFQRILKKFVKKKSVFPDVDVDDESTKSKIASYNRLLSYMRNYNTALNKEKVKDDVKEIENEWKEVGIIEEDDIFDKLDKEFKRLVDNFYKKLESDPIIDLNSPDTSKNQLLKYTENILIVGFPFPIKTIQAIQKTWRAKPNSLEDKEINKKFVFICNQIFEINFMEKQVRAKYPEFKTFTSIELLEAKIDVIEKSLSDDEKLYEELKFLPNLYDDVDKIRAFKNCSTRLQTKSFIKNQLLENIQVLKSVDMETDINIGMDDNDLNEDKIEDNKDSELDKEFDQSLNTHI